MLRTLYVAAFAVTMNPGRVILTFSCPALCASVIRFVAANTCVARVLPLFLLGQVDLHENCRRLRLVTMEVSSPMRDGFHGLNGDLLRGVRDVVHPTANISNPIRPFSNINCGNTHRHLLTGRYPICANCVVTHSGWMFWRLRRPCNRSRNVRRQSTTL